MTDLGTLGGSRSYAVAINDAGDVAGVSWVTGSTYHAFSYSGGTKTDIGTLGGSNSIARFINDAGQVAGRSYLVGNSSYRAFIWTP